MKEKPRGLVRAEAAIMGVGALCSVGNGTRAILDALVHGRVGAGAVDGPRPLRIAATLPPFELENELVRVARASDERRSATTELMARTRRALARAPLPIHAAVLAALEAWIDAGLHTMKVPAHRVAVVAVTAPAWGRRDSLAERYRDRLEQVPPTYALQFLDTDLVSTLSEIVGAMGEGFAIGAASAGSQAAIIKAAQLIRHGVADVCLVAAAPSDLGALELSALAQVGALRTVADERGPAGASRPFDRDASGFVYGEGAAALVLESAASAEAREVVPRAWLRGVSLVLDGTRAAAPNVRAESRTMLEALRDASLAPNLVDYVNAHATSSPLGDMVEAGALQDVFGGDLRRPRVSSSKALVGHCLWSAGALELVLTVLQMGHSILHPQPNLDSPVECGLEFVRRAAEHADIQFALKNSFGFGGINSSVVLERGARALTPLTQVQS